MIKRPRLLALGVFPGLLTFSTTAVLLYLLWNHTLSGLSSWLAIPALFIAFLALWLTIGKLALIPVEDGLVDETQRALWGEIRLPSSAFDLGRVLREAFFSLWIGFLTLILALLAWIPILAPLQIILAAWITAYSFLTPIYARRTSSLGERFILFFRHPFSFFLLGAGLNLLLFLPVLNIFLLGYAQILAALIYFHREGEDGKTLGKMPRTFPE